MASKKMALALETLASGGCWRKALETGYRGREMFETRLRTASGSIVKRVGYKTWLEMSKAGMLAGRSCPRSSVWPEEWILSYSEFGAAVSAACKLRSALECSVKVLPVSFGWTLSTKG